MDLNGIDQLSFIKDGVIFNQGNIIYDEINNKYRIGDGVTEDINKLPYLLTSEDQISISNIDLISLDPTKSYIMKINFLESVPVDIKQKYMRSIVDRLGDINMVVVDASEKFIKDIEIIES